MDLLSSVWNLHLGALNFSILCSRPEDASIYGFQVGSESTNFQMSPIKTYKNHHRNYHKNGEVRHAISHWPRLMWPWWNPPSWAGKNVEISWLVHSLRFTQPPERCGSRQRNANLGGFGENLWWGKQRWPLHERESVETTSKLENSSSPTRQSHMFWRLRAMSLVSSAGSKWLRHIQRIGNGIGQNWGTKRTYEIGHLLGPISLHVGGLWFWPMWRPGTKWWTNNNHNQCWSIGSWLSIGYQLVINWLSIGYQLIIGQP